MLLTAVFSLTPSLLSTLSCCSPCSMHISLAGSGSVFNQMFRWILSTFVQEQFLPCHGLLNSFHNEVSLTFLQALSKTGMILCHPITDSSSEIQDSTKSLFKQTKKPFLLPIQFSVILYRLQWLFGGFPNAHRHIFKHKVCKSNLNLECG